MTDTKTFAETIHIDISIDISCDIYINIGIDSKTLYSVANYWQIKKINFKSYSCSSPLWFLRLRTELKAPNLPPGKMSLRRSFWILAPGGPCMSYRVDLYTILTIWLCCGITWPGSINGDKFNYLLKINCGGPDLESGFNVLASLIQNVSVYCDLNLDYLIFEWSYSHSAKNGQILNY